LIEGLFIYLSFDEAGRMLTMVSELSAARSELAFEYESLGCDPMRTRASSSPVMAAYAALWKGGLPDPHAWLAAHGWLPERHDLDTIVAQYGRSAVGSPAGGFVTATRSG
jgi:O-methyltransferase involved in polyketide biosynthesis